MKKAKLQLRIGLAFLALAAGSLALSVGIIVFNQAGTGVNFGIIYTAFALVVFGALGGSFTYEGWTRLRYLRHQQL